MKKFILGTCIIMSLPAFSQIDYDVINNNTNHTRASERTTKFSEAALAVGKFLDDGLIADDLVKLAGPKRKLNSIEKAQAKFLSCLRKTLGKSKGGYESPFVAATLLKTVITDDTLTGDEGVLESATSACEEANENLVGLKSFEKEKMIKAIDTLDLSMKFKGIISNFSMPKEECVLRNVTAQGAWVIGVGAGVGLIRCLGTDGRVSNYVGPVIRGNVGIGAMVSISNRNDDQSSVTKGKIIKFASSGGSYNEAELNLAVGIGTDNEWGNDSQNINLGFGVTLGGNIQAGIRFINGASRWDLILDSLK
jgi:hypothetical protein